MTKEALNLALEALEFYYDMHEEEADAKAITAIKEALANEALERKAENARELGLDYEPEPVAWEQFYPDMGKPKLAYLSPTESPDNACYIPPQRTWVGLTDEEKREWIDAMPYEPEPRHCMILVNVIEAKLKEKNT